jgi:DNA-binding XRE family transcriptional regulator
MTTYLKTELDNYPTPEIRYRYDPPISNHVEVDPNWLEGQQSLWASTTSAFIRTEPIVQYGESVGFSADMFGDGQSMAPSLSVLDFVGEQGSYGEAPDEFEFTGYGIVRTLGERPRNVRLQGIATSYFGEGTPFLRRFHGHVYEVDRPTLADILNVYRVSGLVAAAPKRPALESPSRAYREFKQLAKWLEVSQQELADIIDVSRTTVSVSWGKEGKDPRNKETARRVYELHSVVSALYRVLGTELAGWLKRGEPGPLELLVRHEYERFERRADEVIFPTTGEPRRRLDTAREPFPSERVTSNGVRELKPAGRARTRRLAR